MRRPSEIRAEREKRREEKQLEQERRAEEQLVQSAGQTETFWTRNVRAITFLICIAVFLAFFGPVSVFTVSRLIRSRTDGRNKPIMTVSECVRLAEDPTAVTFEILSGYRGRKSETDSVENYYIEFGDYLMLATRNKTTKEVLVILENFDTRERIDFLKDDVQSFFERTATAGREFAA